MTLDPTPSEPRVSVLDNGIRVVTDPMPSARSVTTGVWVAVGGRDEAPGIAGVSHFLEHLFFKGTESRSARSIAESVDAVGGDLNAFTSREHTAFHTRLPAGDWKLGVELIGDILSAPALRAHEIDAEREVILEELWAALDTPDDRVHMLSMEGLFPGHPLGREVLGDADTVRAMRRDDIVAFFDTHYRPTNLVVAAAGLVDHDEYCEAVAAHLDLPAGGERPTRRAPEPDVVPLSTHARDGEQVHLVLGWRGLAQNDHDRYALHVANQILGGGSASRLFQTVREDRGLAYSVYSWVGSYSDAGLLGVYAGTSPGRSAELLDVLDIELASILEGGVTEDELRVATGYLCGATELGLEDSGSRMSRLGRMLLSTGTVTSIDEQLDAPVDGNGHQHRRAARSHPSSDRRRCARAAQQAAQRPPFRRGGRAGRHEVDRRRGLVRQYPARRRGRGRVGAFHVLVGTVRRRRRQTGRWPRIAGRGRHRCRDDSMPGR